MLEDGENGLAGEPIELWRREIDLDEGRCLLENVPFGPNISQTHYVSPNRWTMTTDENVTNNIEWWWNMRHNSLCLDTNENIFPLSVSLQTLFDDEYWFLLPEMHIIKQYYDQLEVGFDETVPTYTTKRGDFPLVKSGVFRYDLVCLDERMCERCIVRQVNSATCPTENDYKIYPYPFGSLPALQSHLHPKFVILESGRRVDRHLAKIGESIPTVDTSLPVENRVNREIKRSQKICALIKEAVQMLDQRDPRFALIMRLAGKWTAPRPEEALDDETYNVPMSECDDGAGGKLTTSRNESGSRKGTAASRYYFRQALDQLGGVDNDAMLKAWVADVVRE